MAGPQPLENDHDRFACAFESDFSQCYGLTSMFIAGAQAQSATEIQLSYKDKKFDPAEISAPANTPVVIKLKNLDSKAMEFESKTLKVEKVVAGGSDATINVRAQKPGHYEFFDEYNEKVARGVLIVK